MVHLQRVFLIGLVVWCAVGLVQEMAARRAESASTRPHVLAPRQWTLGRPYLEEVRQFCRQASAAIPEGEVVGVLANPRLGPGQRPMLRMWLAYLMPGHHIRLMPRYPQHLAAALEGAAAGSYFLAYRYRPLRSPRLETVWEHPIGGVYRVSP